MVLALDSLGTNSLLSFGRSWAHYLPALILILTLLINEHAVYGRVRGLGLDSCAGKCTAQGPGEEWTCHCDPLCTHYGDCCADYRQLCLGCAGRCAIDNDPRLPCQCHWSCELLGTCCEDHLVDENTCGLAVEWAASSVTDEELIELSENLVKADVNNYGSQIQLDVQDAFDCVGPKNDDCAVNPLFSKIVGPDYLSLPTVKTMLHLFDHYHAEVGVEEQFSDVRVADVEAFLDAVLDTEVFSTLTAFLQSKRLISSPLDLKSTLAMMWFGLYCRSPFSDALNEVDDGQGGDDGSVRMAPDAACSSPGSSGFEHVFMAEANSRGFIGLHNWLFFYLGEQVDEINYLGHRNVKELPEKKGHLVEVKASWRQWSKNSISSVFVGASPELELALFSTCSFARPDQLCPVSIAGQPTNIQTNAIRDSKGRSLVGTAFVIVP